MAFRASQIKVADAFSNICAIAFGTSQFLQSQRAPMTAASIPASTPVGIVATLASRIASLDAAVASVDSAALQIYAQAQVNDPNYNPAAEYSAMRSAIIAVGTSIMSIFPKDVNGYLLYQTFDANGNLVMRTFTAAQVASVVTLMDTAVSAIG